MRMRNLVPMTLMGVLFAATPAAAQPKLTVEASLSEPEVGVGDVVTLTIRAVALVNGNILVEMPGVNGMTVVGRGESTQMSMSWTSAGQQVRRVKTVQVELSADRAGLATIPPVKASVAGASAASRPLKITVRGDTALPPAAAGSGDVVPPTTGEGDLFVRYRLSRGDAWLGQQVLLDLELFATPRLSFQVDSIPDPPDLDGFWMEVLERPKRLTPRTESVAGKNYQVFRAWRLALFPLQAGPRVLPSVAVSFRIGGNGIFGGGRRARRKTRALELGVQPLPEAGRPAGFSPSNVGNFALSVVADPKIVEAGKAVVLTVRLSGEGNLKSARLPELGAVDGFRVFPPTAKEDVELRVTGVRGTKSAEILLVPERGGRLSLPELSLPVFDPLGGRYEVLRTEPIEIQVRGEPPPPAATAETDDTPGPSTEAKLAPLRFRAQLERPPVAPWTRTEWWVVLTLGPLLWAGAAAMRRLDTNKDHEATARAAARQSEASSRLSELEAAPDLVTASAAFAEALHAHALVHLGSGTRGATTEEVERQLVEAGASSDYAAQVRAALEAGSYARYAPDGAGDLASSISGWVALVEALPKETSAKRRPS